MEIFNRQNLGICKRDIVYVKMHEHLLKNIDIQSLERLLSKIKLSGKILISLAMLNPLIYKVLVFLMLRIRIYFSRCEIGYIKQQQIKL